MAWTELRDTLYDCPKVDRLRRKLGVRYAEAAGCLACLWSWTVKAHPDGVLVTSLGPIEPEELEAKARWEGQPGALYTALWELVFLEDSDEGPRVHDWSSGSHKAAKAKTESRRRRAAGQQDFFPQSPAEADARSKPGERSGSGAGHGGTESPADHGAVGPEDGSAPSPSSHVSPCLSVAGTGGPTDRPTEPDPEPAPLSSEPEEPRRGPMRSRRWLEPADRPGGSTSLAAKPVSEVLGHLLDLEGRELGPAARRAREELRARFGRDPPRERTLPAAM